jgi:hypothetical protein
MITALALTAAVTLVAVALVLLHIRRQGAGLPPVQRAAARRASARRLAIWLLPVGLGLQVVAYIAQRF